MIELTKDGYLSLISLCVVLFILFVALMICLIIYVGGDDEDKKELDNYKQECETLRKLNLILKFELEKAKEKPKKRAKK